MSETKSLRSRLAGWMDGFVPQHDDELKRRGRVFVASCMALVAFGVPFMVWDFVIEGFGPTMLAFSVGMPLMALNPLVLRRTRSLLFAAGIASFELIACLAMMTYAHGGLESAAVVWQLAVPVLAGVWAGPTLALTTALVIVGELATFHYLAQAGHVFPRPLGDESMAIWRFAGMVGVVGFMAVLLWIYERNTLQVLRQRSRELDYRGRLIRAVVDSSMDAVVTFSGNGTIKSWDGNAHNLFGWRRRDAVGSKLFDRILPSHAESIRRSLMRRLSESGPRRSLSERMEIELVDRGGRRFPAELSISPPIELEGARLFTAYIRDLTREKRSQARVRELRRDLLHVIEENPDGMAVYGEPGLMFANRAWEGWFETAGSNKELIDLSLAQDRAELDEAVLTARAGGAPSHLGEFRFVSKGGDTITLDIHAVPGFRFEGADAMLVVARDVTMQQQMRSRLAISDRMAAMGTLLAGVAHEINNPLTYVMGNLSLVELELDQLGASARTRQAVSDANDGADRICEIVRDLQKLSRDESGPPRPIELNGAVRSALKVAHNRVKYSATVVDELGEVPRAMGSEGRIAQVVLNLVINAVQSFAKPDTENNLIRVSSRRALGNRVCVEIRDNGAGIPEEHLDRIFDPFFTTKPVGQGTGLGLAICHNIISSFDGEIAVDSRPGVGTTFRFWLNEAVSAPAAAAPEPAQPEARRCARVLVIDDEPRILKTYRSVLHSHDVTVARSGDDALAQMDGKHDLIVCDIAMPGMSGLELFERARELHPESAKRFVFVTGSFDADTRGAVAELGPEMLEKPVDPAALRELARRAARVRPPTPV